MIELGQCSHVRSSHMSQHHPMRANQKDEFMTPLDALKAGVKTALFAFLTAVLGVVTTELPRLVEALQDHNTEGLDVSAWGQILWGAIVALAIGVVNAVVRYVQVVGPQIFNKVLGKVF